MDVVRLERRTFLATAALFLGGRVLLSGTRCTTVAPSFDTRSIAMHVGDRDAARVLGESYLRDHPEEDDGEWLLRATIGDPRGSNEAIARTVAGQRSRDLQNGDVVIVNGWQLARTEARLCAIACRLVA